MSEPLPLPEPAQTSHVTDSVMRRHEVRSYTAEQMHAYAAAREAAAVAAERERCAAFLERNINLAGLSESPAWQKYTVDLLMGCAAAIRAQKEPT